ISNKSNISKTLNLFVVSAKNTLEITPRMDIFKMLSPKEQFVVLFDAMWNETSWEKFLPPYSGGRPDYVQEERVNIASALSECEVDAKYPFVEWIKGFRLEQGNTEDELILPLMTIDFVYSVFDERIVPALKLFGLLDFEYKKDRNKYLVNRGWGIEWFAVTQFGKKIFKEFVRKMHIKEAGIGEGISEVIVTTKSASGEPNAAPIGIITITNDENTHFMKLYKNSKTLSNVLETNNLAANVTDDAVLFVKAAFEPLNETHFSLFSNFPVLKEANSWIIFDSIFIEKSRESGNFLFQLTPIAIKINRKEVKAINRGLNAVIEAAILATRYALIEDKREQEELKKMMALYADIVEKCGGRGEKEALKILHDKIFL
ncbi:MAG: DUF447 family protein, partial [Methanophagales archaeon]|nr:DUF447 family protein [Methanophagales archaeon]